jgi:undecaprenyl-phosphate galactose phosphotransferase
MSRSATQRKINIDQMHSTNGPRLVSSVDIHEVDLHEAHSAPVSRLPVERLLFLSDLAALSISFVCGGVLASAGDSLLMNTFQRMSFYSVAEAFVTFMVIGLLALLWLDTKGHYNHRLPFWESTSHLFSLAAVGLCAGGFIQFSAKSEYSRLWLGFSWCCFAVFMFAGRWIVRRTLRKRDLWDIPTLIVGEGAAVDSALKALEAENHLGYKILDVLPPSILDDLATPGSWNRMLNARGAKHVMLAIPDYKVDYYRGALQALAYDQVPYSIVPTWFALPLSTLSSHYFFTHGVTVMHNTNRLQLLLPRLIKRTFDIVASGATLVALSPAMAVLMVLVKMDGGPAFFGHKRIGQDGHTFECLKFRSMVTNGAEVLEQHFRDHPEALVEWQREMKLRDDPRVTKIGKILRATSLDEFPQLINVLRGDMSLVGPRPIVAEECARYDTDIALYYMVRPGLTGLWQVSGRNDVSYESRVKLDSLYISNWSFWHDVAIICKTFPVLLKRTGAY